MDPHLRWEQCQQRDGQRNSRLRRLYVNSGLLLGGLFAFYALLNLTCVRSFIPSTKTFKSDSSYQILTKEQALLWLFGASTMALVICIRNKLKENLFAKIRSNKWNRISNRFDDSKASTDKEEQILIPKLAELVPNDSLCCPMEGHTVMTNIVTDEAAKCTGLTETDFTAQEETQAFASDAVRCEPTDLLTQKSETNLIKTGDRQNDNIGNISVEIPQDMDNKVDEMCLRRGEIFLILQNGPAAYEVSSTKSLTFPNKAETHRISEDCEPDVTKIEKADKSIYTESFYTAEKVGKISTQSVGTQTKRLCPQMVSHATMTGFGHETTETISTGIQERTKWVSCGTSTSMTVMKKIKRAERLFKDVKEKGEQNKQTKVREWRKILLRYQEKLRELTGSLRGKDQLACCTSLHSSRLHDEIKRSFTVVRSSRNKLENQRRLNKKLLDDIDNKVNIVTSLSQLASQDTSICK